MARNGKEIDVSVGGVEFRLATAQQVPQSIETIPVRKEQLDTENEPGEQSLSGWWRRSQDSFHEGAGNRYQESREDLKASSGFYESRNVDVWTKNRIALCRRMVPHPEYGTGFSKVKTYATGGTRINLIPNPSFETQTAPWTASQASTIGPAPILVRDISGSPAPTGGSGCLRVDVDVANAPGSATDYPAVFLDGFVVDLPTVRDRPYRISADVYIPTLNPDGTPNLLNLAFLTATGYNQIGNVNDTKDEWFRLSASFNADVDGASFSITFTYASTTQTGAGTAYIDRVLLEEANGDQSYFDGNSPNSVWLGTPEASTSRRVYPYSPLGLTMLKDGDLWFKPYNDVPQLLFPAPAGEAITDGVVTGLNFYAVTDKGNIYYGLVDDIGTNTSVMQVSAPATHVVWAKDRLWVVGDRSIWQPNVLSPYSFESTFTPIYYHPNSGWTYTCVAEGLSAMYFGGHDGRNSLIQVITLDPDGSLPTLSGARTTLSLPEGEIVQKIAVLAGQFLGIGTSKGFRVGLIDGDNLTYGPLIITPPGVKECTGIATFDRFFLVSFDSDDPGVYRVDTGTELSAGVYPYARDVDFETVGVSPTSLAAYSEGRIIATTSDGTLHIQSDSELAESGSLTSGRIRFRTSEPKIFKYLTVDAEPFTAGESVAVKVLDSQNDPVPLDVSGGMKNLPLDLLPPQQVSMSVELTLNRSAADPTVGPVIHSYLIKAMPSVKPQRSITLPLLCFDHETGKSGQRYGGDGFALERLRTLQGFEDVGDTLEYIDYTDPGSSPQQVVIDGIKFVETATPPPGAKGRGGILVLTLRTAEA